MRPAARKKKTGHVNISQTSAQTGLSSSTRNLRATTHLREFYKIIREELKAGKSVIADSTGISHGIRSTLRGVAAYVEGAESHVVCFDNIGQARLRNFKRTLSREERHRVPMNVMHKMHKGLKKSKDSLGNYEDFNYRSIFFVEKCHNESIQGKYVINW